MSTIFPRLALRSSLRQLDAPLELLVLARCHIRPTHKKALDKVKFSEVFNSSEG